MNTIQLSRKAKDLIGTRKTKAFITELPESRELTNTVKGKNTMNTNQKTKICPKCGCTLFADDDRPCKWTGSDEANRPSPANETGKPHWFCKFMRRGFEPPMPFGKTHMVIAARTRDEAKRILQQSGMVSPMYPKITASQTDAEVSYHFKITEDETYFMP